MNNHIESGILDIDDATKEEFLYIKKEFRKLYHELKNLSSKLFTQSCEYQEKTTFDSRYCGSNIDGILTQNNNVSKCESISFTLRRTLNSGQQICINVIGINHFSIPETIKFIIEHKRMPNSPVDIQLLFDNCPTYNTIVMRKINHNKRIYEEKTKLEKVIEQLEFNLNIAKNELSKIQNDIGGKNE